MPKNNNYDLVIIGSGPGGYVAAVRATQLGMKTAIVEKDARLGGVCLNVGCIPSKALLDSSEYYHLARDHFAGHGIKTGNLEIDLKTMMARKNQVVKDLTDQVKQLMEAHKIDVIHGKGSIAGPNSVNVVEKGGEKPSIELKTKNILIATGSEPIQVPGLEFDSGRIVDSTGALEFGSIPKHLVIVGGGYIGLELGSVWMRLGSKVTVVEMLPKIAGILDGQVQRALERLLRSQGFNFMTGVKATGVESMKTKLKLNLDNGEKLDCDRILVAVGRRPLTRGIGLEEAGVVVDASGRIPVDETYQTNVKGVYAIGDVAPGPMLAHKASAEGVAAVECMAGLPGEVNYGAVPSIIYTWPEVASVGLTEEQAKEKNIPCCVGTYPFSGAGRARCMGEKDGFVKLIVHSETDRIIGVHIIGPRAADMIAECVLALEFGASSEDIARTMHGHPTFSEAFQEAARGARSCSIYAS